MPQKEHLGNDPGGYGNTPQLWNVTQYVGRTLVGILRRQGVDVLMQAAIQALPHDLYDTVFAVATDLILADGEVTKEEENLLSSLCEALEISDDVAQEIIRVMLIKNKG